MILQNFELQQIDVEQLKTEIMHEFMQVPLVEETQIENDLAELYSNSFEATSKIYFSNNQQAVNLFKEGLSPLISGRTIWGKIKRFICSILNIDSTIAEIIDAILEAIARLLPGGIYIKIIIEKIVRYIVNRGIGAFCQFN